MNTLTKKREDFKPIHSGVVHMYSCGPTVYGPQHLGNLRSAVLWDFLRRSLEMHGYTVRHVINITDFGHLTSDADEGEDKMLKGLKREGLPITMTAMRELADMYAEKYLKDRQTLGALRPYRLPFASDHIQEQIDLIRRLDEKGFVYTLSDGVYFDTQKDPDYGRLHVCTPDTDTQSRTGLRDDKRHPADFALWKCDSQMGWESPWGMGFPGWHIECSAMSMKYLGETFDIHTGGIEHIDIHHENEYAQSYSATGKPLAHIWLHNDHLLMNHEKIAKSAGNSVYLDDVIERGIDPLAVRYFFMQAHYRSSQNFTWQALEASAQALKRLRNHVASYKKDMKWWQRIIGTPHKKYLAEFKEHIVDDIDIPQALALIWRMIKDTSLSPAQKYKTIIVCDSVLGLELSREIDQTPVDDEIQSILDARSHARSQKDWAESDRLRDFLAEKGYHVNDTDDGQKITSITPLQ